MKKLISTIVSMTLFCGIIAGCGVMEAYKEDAELFTKSVEEHLAKEASAVPEPALKENEKEETPTSTPEAPSAEPAVNPSEDKSEKMQPAPDPEIQTPEPQATQKLEKTEKPVASTEIEIIPKPEQTEEPEPDIPSEPLPEKTAQPEPDSVPVPTQTPSPATQIQALGADFNSAVLKAVNETRASYGNAPMTLDSGLCEKALAHAKDMAERGDIFHACGGAESVTNSSSSGRTIGLRSAVHASGLALDANRSRLGVGSVKIGDRQYTCVFSPQD